MWSQWHSCQAELFIFNCSPSHIPHCFCLDLLSFQNACHLIYYNINIYTCFCQWYKVEEYGIESLNVENQYWIHGFENKYKWKKKYSVNIHKYKYINTEPLCHIVYSTVFPLIWIIKTQYAKSLWIHIYTAYIRWDWATREKNINNKIDKSRQHKCVNIK